ncbi:MAG: alpha/beta hydrolase [Myxococcota bacterium]
MPHAEVTGRKIYYEWHGEDVEATPLALITGIGGSCRGWLPLQVPELSRHRPVLIFDNRGAGGSEDSGDEFSTADLAEDLVGLLDALGLARVHLLGAFMGGMMAQELALANPSRIAGLVLVGTYAHPDAKRRMLLEDWSGLAKIGIPLESMVRKRLVWTLHDDTLESTELIEGMVEFFTREGAPMSAELFSRQCSACIQHDTRSRLADIPHETLILCGQQDQLTPPKFHHELASGIPNSRLVSLPHAAHLVMAEAAELFNDTVVQFLEDL